MNIGIFNFFKKINKNREFKAKIKYTTFYESNWEIKEQVLIESYHGVNIASNEFYLLKELVSRKKDIDIFVVAKPNTKKIVEKRLDNYNLNNINIVIKDSDEYCQLLCTSKYLINSTSFPDYFIKREGQVYLNTWHGTPLKNMGKKDKVSPHAITNIQRNLLMSDYILFPNDYMKKIFIEDYMLDKLYSGTYITAGYPRNRVFFDEDSRERNRALLGLSDKKVIVYMPTWRGQLGKVSNQRIIAYTYVMIDKISKSLQEDEVLYVSLHYLMNQGVKLSDFNNVYPFPREIETYEFLNVADTLITDYSSVMFDFANTGKKVVLYTYDKLDYIEYRGTYLDLDSLPFEQASNEDELMALINKPHTDDYHDFRECYCSLDYNDNAKYLIDLLIDGIVDSNIKLEKNKVDDKNKILIYSGNLSRNGITVSLKSLLSQLDLNKNDYFITFLEKSVKNNYTELNLLPSEIEYIPLRGMVNFTVPEGIALFLFNKFNINNSIISKLLDNVYAREIKRIYPNNRFDYVIQFNGYDRHVIQLFSRFKAKKKTLFTHSDMWQELHVRKFAHKPTLDYAFNQYDNIAIVSPSLKKSLIDNFECNSNSIKVVENTHPHSQIVEKSKQEIKFDNDTVCNIEYSQLCDLLDNSDLTKFINVGRFSPEKGHDRLISAFEKIYLDNQLTRLIIIGGHGILYKDVLERVNQSSARDGIVIIRSMSNPFPILKKCDLFVFSSFYEGLGLVMLESLSLGVPVISTDIPGPREFLNRGYGTLVPDSEEGLYNGMKGFLDNGIEPINIDWDAYNNNAISQFEKLFD